MAHLWGIKTVPLLGYRFGEDLVVGRPVKPLVPEVLGIVRLLA
jgi:hypothetical protein